MNGHLLIIFLLIISILYFIYAKKGGNISHELTGIVVESNDFKESSYKYDINKIFTSLSNKLDIPDYVLDKFGGEYDFVTNDIRKSKKRRMKQLHNCEINGIKDLINEVQKRPYDKVRMKEAKRLINQGGLCFHDCEVEVLNALVLVDEDPLLYMPFYNKSLIEEEVTETLVSLYEEHIGKGISEDYAVLKTIEGVKKIYPDVDKSLLESILKKIDF